MIKRLLTEVMIKRLLTEANRVIASSDTIARVWQNMDERFASLTDTVSMVERKLLLVDELLTAVRVSMWPIVLFRGSMRVDDDVYTDYAWVEKADDKLCINSSPMCTIKLKSITVLNGLYDVVECRIANVDLLATSSARFSPGIEFPIPEKFGELSPAYRVYMRLRSG